MCHYPINDENLPTKKKRNRHQTWTNPWATGSNIGNWIHFFLVIPLCWLVGCWVKFKYMSRHASWRFHQKSQAWKKQKARFRCATQHLLWVRSLPTCHPPHSARKRPWEEIHEEHRNLRGPRGSHVFRAAQTRKGGTSPGTCFHVLGVGMLDSIFFSSSVVKSANPTSLSTKSFPAHHPENQPKPNDILVGGFQPG